MHYVIIGGSAAGVNAIEGIRSVDRNGEITLICDEEYPLYSRCLLSYFLAGTLPEEKLQFKPKDFYQNYNVIAKLGIRVDVLLPKDKNIQLSTKECLAYDKLLLATGAKAKSLAIKGIEKKGVFVLRTINDAKGILQLLPDVETVAILGGGLVGLKAAYALCKQAKNVKVVVKSRQVLSQILDEEGATFIQEHIESQGIEVMKGLDAVQILGKDRVEGIQLDNGETLKCQLILIGKGVSPNIELVKETGIKTQWGIFVDETLRTNLTDIYAAGDVAQTMDITQDTTDVNAIWPAACQQGRIAGFNMAGQRTLYEGSMGMNSVEFFGIPTISMGITKPKTDGFVLLMRRQKDFYKKFVLKDNKIVGIVLVGRIDNSGIIGLLMRKKINICGLEDLLLEDNFDYAKIVPLIKENKDRFGEVEFREVMDV